MYTYMYNLRVGRTVVLCPVHPSQPTLKHTFFCPTNNFSGTEFCALSYELMVDGLHVIENQGL